MRWWLLCLLLTLFYLTSIGQSSNYRFRFVDLPENYRNQLITLVDEDAAGMLWFTTNSGLHRFDGKQVLTFDMQSTPALPDINIHTLLADSRSNVWVATRKGLLRFSLKTWTIQQLPLQPNLPATPSDQIISTLTEGRDGTIYAGSITGKLFLCRGNQLQLITHLRPPVTDSTGSLPGITSVVEANPGTLWLTTTKGQVARVGIGQHPTRMHYYEPEQLRGAYINFLAAGHTRKVLLNTVEGNMYWLDTVTAIVRPLTELSNLSPLGESLNNVAVRQNNRMAFFFADAGNTAGYGEYDFNNYTFKSSDIPYSYQVDRCSFRKVLFKNGKVYAPTDKGVAIISRISSPFRTFQSDLENINSIRAIYRQPDGHLLVSSYKDKLVRVNEATNTVQSLATEMLSCIIPWKGDTLLAGTELGLPFWYLPAQNKLVPIFKNNRSPANASINEHVLCLLQENDSLVWAGAYGGCYLFNPAKGTVVKTVYTGGDGSLQQQNVDDMLKVGNQRFFATTEGIFIYSTLTSQIRKLFTEAGNGFANAWCSCLQKVGNQIWAGTHGNGILVFDTTGKMIRQITTKDGLAGNIVFSLPACNGYIMAGTISGLSVIDIKTGSIRNYSSSQNLPANEFNRAAWFVQGDTVYMGTINGVVRFVPQQLQQGVRQPAALRLVGYSLNDGNQTHYNYSVAYTHPDQLVVPAGTKSFSLNFGGLSESFTEMDLYYRFGTDSSWQRIGQQREITFVGLAPNRYEMQIAARLPDGQWAGSPVTIPVIVKPTFYQTWWFRLLLALTCGTIIWAIIKYRERNLRKEEQLRSRIAGDLHDEVGSALTRIYFQAGMLTATHGNGSTLALNKIASSSQEALSSMSDMVWSIDAHYDNAMDMVSRMRDYIARLHDELECHCTFEVVGNYENLRLSQMVRQNILLIFKEALNNAIKYGCDREIKVQLSLNHHLISLLVKNPLPKQKEESTTVQGGHGLESMKLRAGKIKAGFSAKAVQEDFVVQLQVKPF